MCVFGFVPFGYEYQVHMFKCNKIKLLWVFNFNIFQSLLSQIFIESLWLLSLWKVSGLVINNYNTGHYQNIRMPRRLRHSIAIWISELLIQRKLCTNNDLINNGIYNQWLEKLKTNPVNFMSYTTSVKFYKIFYLQY